MKSRKKGQSTLEYIIVFSAIVVAVLALAYNALSPAVGNVMNDSRDTITNASETFTSNITSTLF